MSALRPSTTKLVRAAWQTLVSPWKDVFYAVENDADVFRILDIIGTHSLDVSGVYVDHVQYNFSKVSKLVVGDVGDLFAVLHALRISAITGVPHDDLSRLRPEWMTRCWALHIDETPIFVLCCRKSFRSLAEFICKHLGPSPLATLEQQDAQGDTALHIAVRRRHWSWAQWLIQQGCNPHRKNKRGESAFLLSIPFHEKLNLFKVDDPAIWYAALHEGLAWGRSDARWALAMLDAGADVNQPILYDSPLDCLLVYAQYGLDMNLGPLPPHLMPEHYRILYLHGRVPTDWTTVIDAFDEDIWVRFLRAFHTNKSVTIPDEFVRNLTQRKAISEQSVQVLKRMKELLF